LKQNKTNEKKKMATNLLALGDSMTQGSVHAGYCSYYNYPFTTRLELLLNGHLSIDKPKDFTRSLTAEKGSLTETTLTIDNAGKAGEQTADMLLRLRHILATKSKTFEYATVLTGLNDLKQIHDLPELCQLAMDDIKRVCAMCYVHMGANVCF
jgi:lysophospholipase L1-like esterase